MRSLASFVFFVFVIAGSVSGQYLKNPSLEGPPGISVTPPDWSPFGEHSTPDTEPLCDEYPASDGDTYMTLVARGSESAYPNTSESCQAQLISSLETDTSYMITLDLASRDDVGYYKPGEGFIYYTAEVKLKIYGSNSWQQFVNGKRNLTC